jgi:hypothetical protein
MPPQEPRPDKLTKTDAVGQQLEDLGSVLGDQAGDPALMDLGQRYDDGNSLAEHLLLVQKEVEATREGMKSLGQDLGTKADGSSPETPKLEELKRKLAESQAKTKKAERGYLGVSEGQPKATETVGASEDLTALLKEVQAETKQARKKFVREHIQATVERLLTVGNTGDNGTAGFKDELEKCQNRNQAEQIIRLKTENQLMDGLRGFIEGEEPDFHWECHMECATFNDPSGKEIMYVTAIDYNINDRDMKVKAALGGEAQEQLVAAESAGDLRREKV